MAETQEENIQLNDELAIEIINKQFRVIGLPIVWDNFKRYVHNKKNWQHGMRYIYYDQLLNFGAIGCSALAVTGVMKLTVKPIPIIASILGGLLGGYLLTYRLFNYQRGKEYVSFIDQYGKQYYIMQYKDKPLLDDEKKYKNPYVIYDDQRFKEAKIAIEMLNVLYDKSIE